MLTLFLPEPDREFGARVRPGRPPASVVKLPSMCSTVQRVVVLRLDPEKLSYVCQATESMGDAPAAPDTATAVSTAHKTAKQLLKVNLPLGSLINPRF
jgi:hypothetical protein